MPGYKSGMAKVSSSFHPRWLAAAAAKKSEKQNDKVFFLMAARCRNKEAEQSKAILCLDRHLQNESSTHTKRHINPYYIKLQHKGARLQKQSRIFEQTHFGRL